MPYTPLSLPQALPSELEIIIRGSIEGYLREIHYLLTFSTEIGKSSYAIPYQLGFSSALMCLTTVAGASSVLLERGSNKKNFIKILEYYPWEYNSLQGLSSEDAAETLYKTYRNPLSHSFSITSKKTNKKIKIVTDFGKNDEDIEVLEKCLECPSPFLKLTDHKITLNVNSFYWGIRKMIERRIAKFEDWSTLIKHIKSGSFES